MARNFMGHLSPDELLDLAEETRPVESAPHARTCASCQAELTRLRAALAAAAGVQVPEPSPLFWDHFSSRVRDAVAVEAPLRRSWLSGRSRRGVPLASAAGIAALVVVVVVAISSRGVLRQTSPSTTPAATPSAGLTASLAAPAVEPLADPGADPAFTFVADVTSDMNLDTALQAGLVSDGSADHAVEHLNEGELRELERLLTDAIAHAQTS